VLTLIRSEEFDVWLRELVDRRGKAQILARLDRASLGNFGDCKPVGEGVSEMRIEGVRPGHPVYFVREGFDVYRLLVGGSKSTQKRDIKQAIGMARELKQGKDP
jgi:putative addiction module killer protein